MRPAARLGIQFKDGRAAPDALSIRLTRDRTIERTDRPRCNRRECPQELRRLEAAGIRRRQAGQEGHRSRQRRPLTFARCS